MKKFAGIGLLAAGVSTALAGLYIYFTSNETDKNIIDSEATIIEDLPDNNEADKEEA